MKNQTKNGFSRREWLMLIAIILMIEAWVLNSSYEFKEEQTVINYISFASTIASLLLAVIAIIYGFYQSDGQHKIATALELQIDSMKPVQDNLDGSSQAISSQISAIEDTANYLERQKLCIEKTHLRLGDLAGGIAEISQKQSGFQEMLKGMTSKESQASDSVQKESLTRQILRRSTFEADLLGYWLFLYMQSNELKNVDFFDILFDRYVNPLGKAAFDEKDRSVWSGAGFQIIAILRACNLVSTPKHDDQNYRVLILSEALKSELPKIAEEVKEQTKTKEGAKILDQAFAPT